MVWWFKLVQNFEDQVWGSSIFRILNQIFSFYRFREPTKFLGVSDNFIRMFMINFVSSRSTHISYCYCFYNNTKIYSKNILSIIILIEMMFLSHRWIFSACTSLPPSGLACISNLMTIKIIRGWLLTLCKR